MMQQAQITVVLVSGLKAGRLASSCLKLKDLSVSSSSEFNYDYSEHLVHHTAAAERILHYVMQ